MLPEEKIKEEFSEAFSARIDITNVDEKLKFIGSGDGDTGKLFLQVLKRLENRMKESDFFVPPLYHAEQIQEKEIVFKLSKEQVEELLYAILLL